jgi:nucleotide-binding universal stress UspA family protein
VDVVYGEADSNAPEAASRVTRVETVASACHIGSAQVHVLDGDPSQSLSGFAAKQSCDAVVLGALSHRENLTSLVGELTGRLVEALTCDFVLIKASEAVESRPAPQSHPDSHPAA